MNVQVNRVAAKFGAVDEIDAVKYAELVLDSVKRVVNPRDLSAPSRRELNMALAYLQAKYPFQCCESGKGKPMCQDCPMKPLDNEISGKR